MNDPAAPFGRTIEPRSVLAVAHEADQDPSHHLIWREHPPLQLPADLRPTFNCEEQISGRWNQWVAAGAQTQRLFSAA